MEEGKGGAKIVDEETTTGAKSEKRKISNCGSREAGHTHRGVCGLFQGGGTLWASEQFWFCLTEGWAILQMEEGRRKVFF